MGEVKFSSYMVHHLTSPIVSEHFWTGFSQLLDMKKGTHSPGHLIFLFGFLLLGVCKRHHYHEKVQNVIELCGRIIRAAVCYHRNACQYLVRN